MKKYLMVSSLMVFALSGVAQASQPPRERVGCRVVEIGSKGKEVVVVSKVANIAVDRSKLGGGLKIDYTYNFPDENSLTQYQVTVVKSYDLKNGKYQFAEYFASVGTTFTSKSKDDKPNAKNSSLAIVRGAALPASVLVRSLSTSTLGGSLDNGSGIYLKCKTL